MLDFFIALIAALDALSTGKFVAEVDERGRDI